MTDEVTQQLKSLLDYKISHTRRVCHQDKQNGKTITEVRTPHKEGTDLIFAVYQDRNLPNPESLYDDLGKSFGKKLELRVRAVEKRIIKGVDGSRFIPLGDS